MPRAPPSSLGGVDAEAGETRAAPALEDADLGSGPRPSPALAPGSATPQAASAPHYLGHLLPIPSKLRRICLHLISKPFLYLFFFQGRSNIFQMRQNRDGSEAFSAGA